MKFKVGDYIVRHELTGWAERTGMKLYGCYKITEVIDDGSISMNVRIEGFKDSYEVKYFRKPTKIELALK